MAIVTHGAPQTQGAVAPKIISDPIAFLAELHEGILLVHPAKLLAAGDPWAIVRATVGRAGWRSAHRVTRTRVRH